jgi:hypothetical protein
VERRAWNRVATQRSERGRSGHTVRLQAGEALVGAHGRLDVRAEGAVEDAGWKATPGEPELKRRYIPADAPEAQDAAAEGVTSERSQRPAHAWSGDAIHRQAGPSLDGSDAGRCRRPGKAIDRARVEALCPERHLQRGGAYVTSGLRLRRAE